MVYVILYSILTPGTQTGSTSALYYGLAHNLADAEKKFNELILTPECFQKEIWSDDGKGYRRLIKYNRYKPSFNMGEAV